MANLSENYSLKLPTEDELVDIDVLNSNFELIDAQMADTAARVSALVTYSESAEALTITTTDSTDTEDSTDE